MREIYASNQSLFFDIRDELTLRGIQIQSKVPNNYLPSAGLVSTDRLLVQEPGEKYHNINFDLLGLNNFLSRFNVVDDTFFNHIPIEGFIRLNSGLNPSIIADVFHAVQMKLSLAPKTKSIDNSPPQKEKAAVSFERTPIRDFFHETKFISFIRYAYSNKLEYVEEINEKHMEAYRHQRMVGIKKYNDFLERLQSYSGVDAKTGWEAADTEEKSYGLTKPILIEEAFGANILNSFVSFCKEYKLTYVTEITPQAVESYGNRRGIGKARVESIEKILEKLLKDEKKLAQMLEKEVSKLPIYPLIKNMSIENVIGALEIKGTSLTDEELKYSVIQIDTLGEANQEIIKKALFHILPLNDIAEKVKIRISERDITTLTYRSDPQETLETIGEKLGVTRERARQIILKTGNLITRKLGRIGLMKTIQLMKYGKFGLSEEVIKDSMDKENYFLLTVLRNLKGKLYYDAQTTHYFTEAEKSILDELIVKIQDMPDLLLIDEFYNFINIELNGRVR